MDGGYLNALARDEYHIWFDFDKLSAMIHSAIAANTREPLDLLRTYYYDCLPFQGNPPTPRQVERMSSRKKFFDSLRNLTGFTVREGRLVHRGYDVANRPIFQQKGIDLLLGLDFALLAAKHQITHSAVVSGDGDLIPALEIAQQEGIRTWLVHGPTSTYAAELWRGADDRILITQEIADSVAQTK